MSRRNAVDDLRCVWEEWELKDWLSEDFAQFLPSQRDRGEVILPDCISAAE